MNSVHDQLRAHLLEGIKTEPSVRLYEVMRSQWSDEFVELMRNRLTQGYFRYAPLHEGRPYDNVKSAQHRLKLYLETGNQEHLVDVANLCLCEFVKPGSHSRPFFHATDDGVHAQGR
jgi:hypothetical protein